MEHKVMLHMMNGSVIIWSELSDTEVTVFLNWYRKVNSDDINKPFIAEFGNATTYMYRENICYISVENQR